MSNKIAKKNFLENKYIIAFVGILVILYASKGQVNLPKPIYNLFKNDIFRVIYLSLLVLVATKAPPHVAFIVALVYVLTLYFIDKQENSEQIRNTYN